MEPQSCMLALQHHSRDPSFGEFFNSERVGTSSIISTEQAKPCNLFAQVFGPGIPHCSRGNDIDPRLGFRAVVLDAGDSASCVASS